MMNEENITGTITVIERHREAARGNYEPSVCGLISEMSAVPALALWLYSFVKPRYEKKT